MTCSHHYKIKVEWSRQWVSGPLHRWSSSVGKDNLYWCLICKEVFEHIEDDSQELHMPPIMYWLTPELWKRVRPWPKISFEITELYKWYISMIGFDNYLIMPIIREGKEVFYSARRLTDCGGLKYAYPKGVKRIPWVSSDDLKSPVILCEGVADAAYLSPLYSSVALLGNYYNTVLDPLLKDKDIVVMLDGDAVGISSAMKVATEITVAKSSKIALLENNFDPTDLRYSQITQLVRGV